MKTLRYLCFSFVCFVCFVVTLGAASPDIHIAVTDFTLAITPGNRTVTLTPVLSGTTRSGTSDSTGSVTLSTIAPKDYTLTISGSDISLTIRVPESYALLHARDLVIGDWTRPTASGSSTATANLRAWSLLGTDPLALPGALKLSGQTNEIGDNGTAITFNGSPIGGGDTVWTNDNQAVHTLGDSTNQTLLFGQWSVATNVYPSLADYGAIFVRDQASGDQGYQALEFAGYDDITNKTNWFEITLSGNSGAPNVGLSVNFTSAGNGENWDIFAEGDVYSQFNFSTSIGSPNDGVPLIMAPNYIGDVEASSDTAAYKFGTSQVLTNGFLAVFSNAGTNVVTIDRTGKTTASGGFAKGSFTGITTTNTVYTTGPGGTGSVTNVIVVQGGIITSWTVTP